ncbi:MAG: carbamoyl transferase [Planctomycetota bacterium]|nr:carbamoyl transferase [Planctomycetota bacterium]
MRILGISAFHRDAAAALVVDGVPVAAAQEERFTRKRLDPAFPKRAIRYCLRAARIDSHALDHVVFYEKPLRRFERMLVTQLKAFPRSARIFSRSMFLWLGDRLWMKNRIVDELAIEPSRVLFTEHQAAHAASAFFASPFEEAAILTVDDAGEWATTALGRGSASGVEILSETYFPHSLGLLVSAITQFLGFEPGADEDKVEALAALGKPRLRAAIEELVPAGEDGGFTVDASRFRFAFDPDRLVDERLEELLGPARRPGSPLRIGAQDPRDADLAASLQEVLEDRLLALAVELARRVPSENLCYAGEVARNRRANARLLADGPFRRMFIPPAPGEAGAALGAALLAHALLSETAGALGALRTPRAAAATATFLGEDVDGDQNEDGRALAGENAVVDEILRRVLDGQAVGWVRGRMELGPRSLGNRSILADPRNAEARANVLRSIKKAEEFLPGTLAVTAEQALDLFEIPPGGGWPLRFGQLAVRCRDGARETLAGALLPDGTAWIQTVEAEHDPAFHRLLERFGRESDGPPVLLHETLSLRGSPMVRTGPEAVELLRRSTLDCLVVADWLYEAS